MFAIVIARDADLQIARDLAETTVQSLPFVIKAPAAQSWIDTIEPNGIKLQVVGWINQHDTSMSLAKGEAIRQVKLALAEADIALPATPQIVAVASKPSAKRGARPAKETTNVAPVSTNQEDALEELIDAERAGLDGEDLLDDAALKE